MPVGTDLMSWIRDRDAADVAEVMAQDPVLARWRELQDTGYSTFRPRPDRPEEFDQQSSFVNNKDAVAFFLKGNAAGGTTAAAYKTAQFVLHDQPPPRRDTPFWIISNTYEQCCGTCWNEKLLGEGYIPDCEIDWPRVRWLDAKAGHPKAVPLKPWRGKPGKNWVLEFKSFEQGRKNMQARSIGGFWFSEQFPEDIFIEVLRAVRDTMYPGGQFCEFTPIEPALCTWIERLMDKPPPGWAFYRGNTALNRPNLAQEWYDQFFAAVPDEMLATRQTGALASYQGVIYPSFNTAVHVVGDDVIVFPPNVRHRRSVDWGASEEHPQTCLWGYYDGMGDWFIYDEYWCNLQDKLLVDHAVEILARSIYWGWLPPPQCTDGQYAQADKLVAAFVESVQERLQELSPETVWWKPEKLEKPGPASQKDRPAPKTPPRPPEFLWLARQRGGASYGATWCDPARPGEITAFGRYGLQPAPASNDVYLGIDYVRSLLKIQPASGKPRIFIHQRCKHLIEELRKYRWKPPPKATGIIQHAAPKPEPLKKDDDTVDALRYMVFSEHRDTGQTASVAGYSQWQQKRQSIKLHQHGGPRQWLRG